MPEQIPFTFGSITEAASAANDAWNDSVTRSVQRMQDEIAIKRAAEKEAFVKTEAVLKKEALVEKAHGEAIFTNRQKDRRRDAKFLTKKVFKPFQAGIGLMAVGAGKLVNSFGPMMGMLEGLGVFEPILSVVSDLIGLFAGKLIEKLLPAFMRIINILLSDEMMSLIGTLADLFVILIEPLLQIVEAVLPPLIDIIEKTIIAFMPLIEDVMEALMPIIMELIDAFMPLIGMFVNMLMPILDPLLKLFIPIIKIALIPLKIILSILGPILEGLAPLFKIIGDVLIMLEGPLDMLAHILSVVVMTGVKIAAFAIAVLIDSVTLGMAGAVKKVKKMFKKIEDPEGKGEEKEKMIMNYTTGEMVALQSGTPYVPESGIYHLTKGERVVTAEQNASGGNGDIHIVVEGNLVGQNAMQELMEEIEYKRSIGRF